MFSRDKKMGQLTIRSENGDMQENKEGETPGVTDTINVNPPLLLGGLPELMKEGASRNLDVRLPWFIC